MSNRKQRKEIDKAIRNIIKFAEQQPIWQQRQDDLIRDLLAPAAESLSIEVDKLLTELHDAGYWSMVFGFVFEAFASIHWDNEERSFIDVYLKQRGWREAPGARRYLQAMNKSEARLWEVTGVKAGFYAEVRPYGSDDQPVRVLEKSGTQSVHQWDCLVARVIRLNNALMFTGSILPLPPAEAARVQRVFEQTRDNLIEMMQKAAEEGEIGELPDGFEQAAEDEVRLQLPDIYFRIWLAYLYRGAQGGMPELQNTDGESFEVIKVRFPLVGTTEAVAQVLDGIPELDNSNNDSVWAWLSVAFDDIEEGEPVSVLGHLFLRDGSLDLEVNSSERAQKGSQWLSEKLKGLVGQPLTMHENLADKLENTNTTAKINLNQNEEAQTLIQAHLDKHYQQTLDEPIPMLNNQSPRECAADPDLHGVVVEWLKTLENGSAHSPMSDYDFSWIWEELDLVKYRL